MGFRHQLWKQKGEEYRVHGRWGWLWLSSARRQRRAGAAGLLAGPAKVAVCVRTAGGSKVLALEPAMFEFVKGKFEQDDGKEIVEVDEMAGGDAKRNDDSE